MFPPPSTTGKAVLSLIRDQSAGMCLEGLQP